MSVKYEADVQDIGSPSQEHRNLHPTDTMLRRHGFRVQARPSSGPALWRLGTRVYTEPQAVTLCDEIEAARAGGR